MYQFNANFSVVEVREGLQKLVRRGMLAEAKMISLVKKFAEEKERIQEGQRYITIVEM